MTACPRADVDLLSRSYLDNPCELFDRLRTSAPVAYVESVDAYVVTSHELVCELLGDTVRFSNRRQRLGAEPNPKLTTRLAEVRCDGWEHTPVIADQDPPLHDTFRAVVAPFFTPARMRTFRQPLVDICHDLIDRWDPTGPIEFIEAFASPLPLRAIARVLDLPTTNTDEQIDQFARWRDAAIAAVGSDLTDDEIVEAERDVVAMQHFLADRIECATDPDEDMFAALRLAQITDTDGSTRRLTMEEMLTIARQVFVGGVETTTKALAELMLQLDGRPDLFDALATDGSRRRILEESLRLSSPAQGIMRITTTDVSIGGCDIPANSHVLVMFAAANRDPAALNQPDTLDPTRSSIARHLAFGRGVHVCLGAAFARIEMLAAIETLRHRVKSYRVLDRDAVRYHPSYILRGPQAVWIDAELRVD